MGDGLFTEALDGEEPCVQTVETYYLDTMPKAEEDQPGADSTRFLEVPLDLMFQYHARAKRVVSALELEQERKMLASGLWLDTLYSGCSFMAARCKRQRSMREWAMAPLRGLL